MEVVFLIQLFASFFLCGLIWIVQLVHYPSFKYVDNLEFTKFELFHTKNISFIVVPIMVLELATAIILAHNSLGYSKLFFINLILVLTVWLVTFVFSVPCHQKLTRVKNLRTIDLLVKTNWLRTFIWTLKALLLIYTSMLVFNFNI